jgi:hypothetical protein
VVIDVDENDEHYIPCLYDRRFKKDFSKKFEEKYNILLMESAKVFFNSGRGGAQDQRREPGTFSIQNQRIDVPNEVKPLSYSFVVVGNLLDI